MKYIDLTHTINSQIPTWDLSCGFSLETKTDYPDCTPPDLFRVQKFLMNAGIGTHMDAPAHCCPGGKVIHELELKELIANYVVIKVDGRQDTVILPEVVEAFEKDFGLISPGTFVLFDTGWGKYWNEKEKYHNNYMFPSIHEDTARLLLKRDISGLGTDTLSADTGKQGFPVHRLILGAGKYLVENVKNIDLLPAVGNKIFIMPIKIEGGTEAPIRLIAEVD